MTGYDDTIASISEVAADTRAELEKFGAIGAGFLEVVPGTPPKAVVGRLKDFMTEVLEQGRKLTEEQIIGLGVLLGNQYVDGLGWHWGEVTYPDDPDNSWTCVLSENNAVGNNPISWMMQVAGGERRPSFMLNYNMVAANQVPPAPANRALMLY